MGSVQVKNANFLTRKIAHIATPETVFVPTSQQTPSQYKAAIRTSLKASTIDGIFAAVFSITTTGILLSKFLVELDTSPLIFGMLSSIPMVVNLIQPLGAYISERTTSRFKYSFLTYGSSRLLWLALVTSIVAYSCGLLDSHQLLILTLIISLISSLLGGLGTASWLSWLSMIVPQKLRGRYFGLRNSLANLTNLICIPLAGLVVSKWSGGTLQGYGVVLFIGILSGFISLACQYFKLDVNPQQQNTEAFFKESSEDKDIKPEITNNVDNNPGLLPQELLNTKNSYLVYFTLWMFAFNLSNPFFNLYLLDNLHLDVSWVTLYGSLQAGANLLMLILWGRLADKIGNRPILIFTGILVAITPMLWLGIGSNNLDKTLWLPLLHIFTGGTWAAIDLCSNNLQLTVAPSKNQSSYFGKVAAFAGVSGALGTTLGSFLIQFANLGGLPGLFAISSIFRLLALIPLGFIKERGSERVASEELRVVEGQKSKN
jgi:MFS family permease